MSSKVVFKVKLYGFEARDLPPMDGKTGSSDPFVEGDFDSTKNFKTPVLKKTLNPTWDFAVEFDYDTHRVTELHRKFLSLGVFDWDAFGKNDFIGAVNVDLLKILVGPEQHTLKIRDEDDEGSEFGTLSFKSWARQVSQMRFVFSELECSNIHLPKKVPSPLFQVRFSLRGKHSDYYVSTAHGTSCHDWADPTSIEAFDIGTVEDFMETQAEIVVMHSERGPDDLVGIFSINLKPLIEAKTEEHSFHGVLLDGHGAENGTVKGKVHLSNFCMYSSQKGGLHTESGITPGVSPVAYSYTIDSAPRL